MHERARELRKEQTEAEAVLWRRLRRRQLEGWKFRRQHPVGPYVVDFVCLARHLVVEVDGGQHIERAEFDRRRSRFLQSRGLRVLRFWNNEVLGQLEAVLETIRQALLQPAPSP
ncbi:MAG: hypothetical protein KatS3mg102_0635 [Planctomycetota bacterium]|nr:MAG: hypothetical protein KatS3mg102_0635 [Planctomycetota bacterium]